MANKIGRMALGAAMAGALQIASAQANFSLISATYTLDSSGPFSFNFIPDGAAMAVDIIPNAPSFEVGGSTTFGTGVGTILYTVTTSVPISGIVMTVQGNVQQWGEVNWTETAETGSTNLGSISGFKKGSSYQGGADGAFTQVAELFFNQPVESFKVKKSFDIDIGANQPPSPSIAQVSLIEQNLDPVPEPCTLVGLAAGASVLAVRRRSRERREASKLSACGFGDGRSS